MRTPAHDHPWDLRTPHAKFSGHFRWTKNRRRSFRPTAIY